MHTRQPHRFQCSILDVRARMRSWTLSIALVYVYAGPSTRVRLAVPSSSLRAPSSTFAMSPLRWWLARMLSASQSPGPMPRVFQRRFCGQSVPPGTSLLSFLHPSRRAPQAAAPGLTDSGRYGEAARAATVRLRARPSRTLEPELARETQKHLRQLDVHWADANHHGDVAMMRTRAPQSSADRLPVPPRRAATPFVHASTPRTQLRVALADALTPANAPPTPGAASTIPATKFCATF